MGLPPSGLFVVGIIRSATQLIFVEKSISLPFGKLRVGGKKSGLKLNKTPLEQGTGRTRGARISAPIVFAMFELTEYFRLPRILQY